MTDVHIFKLLFRLFILSLSFVCCVSIDYKNKFEKYDQKDLQSSVKPYSLIQSLTVQSKLNCLAKCNDDCLTVVYKEDNGVKSCYLYNATSTGTSISASSTLYIKKGNYYFL